MTPDLTLPFEPPKPQVEPIAPGANLDALVDQLFTDYKDLWKRVGGRGALQSQKEFEEFQHQQARFRAIYVADKGFERISHKSLLRLLKMNSWFWVLGFQRFGKHIDTDKL